MKTFKLITPILLSAVVVLAAGCGDDPVRPDPPKPHEITWDDQVDSRIQGVWLFTSATVGGNQADLGETLDFHPNSVCAAFGIVSSGDYAYLEFDSNYDPVIGVEGTVATGTCNKNEQHFKINAPDASYEGTWSRKGDTLTLNTKLDGTPTVFKAEFIPVDGSPVGSALLGR